MTHYTKTRKFKAKLQAKFVQLWLSRRHRKLSQTKQQWLWFVALWFFGVLATVALTLPIKILFKIV